MASMVATGGSEAKVTTALKNKPRQVVFLVPAELAPGTHDIEVRARVGGGSERHIG